MGSLCFSSASILRCESFTSLESVFLIIPTALELLFASVLIFKNWGTGWRHLLLSAEGWSYFALALLELLSHNIPAVRDSVSVFSVVDIVLAAASFLPIFFYTLFVYLFTRRELTASLPKRYQSISNILIPIFIPAIVVLNELSSFLGISRRTLISNGREVVAIGFRTVNDQQLWTFLTSVTLAVLTAFQAINFSFAFYRLVRAFVDQRRIEATSSDQAHLIRGIGWITAGLKLGAIETVIGFAQGGFGGAITRRSLRFLGRAFLVIGIVKGVDRVDDFTEVTKELNSAANRAHQRRSRFFISNPRLSTFQQLSPTANEFYAAPRAPTASANVLKRNSTKRSIRPQSMANIPEMAEFSQLRREATLTRGSPTAPPMATDGDSRPRKRERVTVHYAGGSAAPTLEMRFSGLDMPSPALIAESVKARPVSSSWVSIARSSQYNASMTAPSFAFDPPPVPMTYPEFIYDRNTLPRESGTGTSVIASPATQHRRGVSEFSARSSGYPDSLNAVRELGAQFPIPSGYPTPIEERSEWHDDDDDDDVEAQRRSVRAFDPISRPSVDSAYAASTRTRTPPRRISPLPAVATQQSPEHAPLRYAYGGMEYPDSPEPVYQYNYDGDYRAPHPAAYSPPVFNPNPVSPPTATNATSYGNTPMTNHLSPFGQDVAIVDSTTTTPNTDTEYSNPFEYDAVPRDVLGKGKGPAYRTSTQGVPQPVFMDDGPHSDAGATAYAYSGPERSSAVLLQMTQREDVDWTPAEFTPSMLVPSRTPSSATASTGRATLKKKRRPSGKSEKRPALAPGPFPGSTDTYASSWLHGGDDADADIDTGSTESDGTYPYAYPVPASAAAPMPARVKSVGRVRAPHKTTPAPINARHGMTRGSVYIQPIHVPPSEFRAEVEIVQGGSSAGSNQSEFVDAP